VASGNQASIPLQSKNRIPQASVVALQEKIWLKCTDSYWNTLLFTAGIRLLSPAKAMLAGESLTGEQT